MILVYFRHAVHTDVKGHRFKPTAKPQSVLQAKPGKEKVVSFTNPDDPLPPTWSVQI